MIQITHKTKERKRCKYQRFRFIKKSARRDSNPKVPKKAHKIKEERTLSSNCLQNEDSLNRIYKSVKIL